MIVGLRYIEVPRFSFGKMSMISLETGVYDYKNCHFKNKLKRNCIINKSEF